jgi:hemolysin activation/secretion protein
MNANFSNTRAFPFRLFIVVLFFLLTMPDAFAAAPRIPDSGAAMREAQSARPQAVPRHEDAGIEGLQKALPQDDAGGATIAVREFKLEDLKFLKEEEVQAILNPYKNRSLTLSQLEEAVNAVTELYRKRGYIMARAYLPRQDARDGVIIIRALIGTYGPSSLENKSLVRDWFVKKALQNLEEGKPVRRQDLERAVLLVNDMPGAAMPKLNVAPGREAGTSDFFMEAPAGKRFGAFLMSDNHGSRYTGRWRFGGGAEINSPLGMADKLSVFALTTDTAGLSSESINYALPLGGNGLRLNLGYSHVYYRLGDDYEELEATGWADTYEATFSYPIIRSSDQNLYATFNLAHKTMQDDIQVFDQYWNKFSNSAKFGLQYEKWGSLFGRGVYTAVTGSFTYGNLHIPDGEQREFNQAGADTHGDFAYVNLGILTNISLAENWTLSLSASGQKAIGRNLDGSEQFNVTGANGVKSYSEVISGDDGYLLNAELRYTLPSFINGLHHSLGAFVDQGGWRYARPDYALKQGDSLTDVGLGYSLSYGPASVKVQLAHAVGEYPSEIREESRTRLMALFMVSF